MLEKVDGVIVALPDGADKKVLIHAKRSGVLTEASAKKLIEEGGKFKVKQFTAKKIERKT
jgi:hypothetical protein